ncbi:hypothetical protein GJAV_G00196400 [Gymnothorax javanicus]|nr:hypothetical protein GJAV_G00196400 [Gymnothorax javanicus]
MGRRCYFLFCLLWNVPYVESAHRISKLQGESVIFPLSSDMANLSDVSLRKNGTYLFRWSRNEVNQRYVGRLSFHGNRTLRLDELEERDAGLYKMEQFDVTGKVTDAEITVTLTCFKGFHVVYGELGGPVAVFGENLTGLSELSDAKWEKNGSLIAQLNQSRPVYPVKPEGRLMMLPQGECRLFRVQASDAGNHTLEVSTRYLNLRWTAQLVIRVPHPSIEQSCRPDGQASFRCVVKWELPTVWFFNESSQGVRFVNDTELLLSYFPGKLVCALKDHRDMSISVSFTCAAPGMATTEYILIAVCSSLVLVLMLSLARLFIHIKKQRTDQNLQLSTMAPKESIHVYELTDMNTIPSRPASVPGEEIPLSSRLSMPTEMTTFHY